MSDEWTAFRARAQAALGEMQEGRPEAFKALWSHGEDVSILGGFGGYERGWAAVGPRLDWASARIDSTNLRVENLLTVVGDDVAFTVDLERMERNVGGVRTPRLLRCTQGYRREAGEWKIVHRHADEVAERAG
jgi:hypothetical protein